MMETSSNETSSNVPVVIDAESPVRGGYADRRLMMPGGQGGGMTSAGDAEESFDPSSLLHSLRRHWHIALVLGLLLGPPLAFAGWTFLVPTSSAVGYLRVDAVNAVLAFETADRRGGGDSFEMYKSTQAQLIKTPFVLNKALADPNVRELPQLSEQTDAFNWLSDVINVNFPGKGEVMAIQATTENMASSKAIVDAVIKAYMNEAVLDERNERLQRVDNLERVYAEAEGKVRARRADIRKLADTLGTGDSESLSLAQQLAVSRYGQVQSELGKVEFQLMKSEGELDAYRQLAQKIGNQADDIEAKLTLTSSEADANETAEGEPDDSSENPGSQLSDYEKDRILNGDRQYQTLISKGRSLREEIFLYETKFGKGMVQFQEAQLERVADEVRERKTELLRIATEEKLRRVSAGISDSAIDPSLSPEQQQAAAEQAKLKKDKETKDQIVSAREIQVGVLRQQKQRIESDLAELDREAKKLGRSSIDIEMMRAEISSLDEVLNRLAGEIERTKVELKSDGRISVISDATPMPGSDAKKRYVATGGLGLVGFFLPFLGLIGLDVLRKPVNSTQTIDRGLSVPVLGSIPRSKRVNAILNEEKFCDGEFGNSVSSIVAMLVNMSRFENNKVIMVTSAVAGEGKTTLANSIWRGLREANFKTVLVDFDLRRPMVHKNFKVEMGKGVAEIVTGQAEWSDCIHPVGEHCAFITAGADRPVNLSAVAHDGLPNMFAELRDQYDFVIVDTPPILPVVDTRVIGEHVDTAVLAVMKDRSRVPQLIAANETLRAHGTPVMGVVVNGCKSRNGGYSYKY